MAPFRRGGRGGRGGFARGGGRGGIVKNDRLARSGIKTKHGYRKFDSQRLRDDLPEPHYQAQDSADEQSELDSEGSETEDGVEAEDVIKPYNSLLQAFHHHTSKERQVKRSKVEELEEALSDADGAESEIEEITDNSEDVEEPVEELDAISDDEEPHGDPYKVHFDFSHTKDIQMRLNDAQGGVWKAEKHEVANVGKATVFSPSCIRDSAIPKKRFSTLSDLSLKQRLVKNAMDGGVLSTDLAKSFSPYLFGYMDVMIGSRTPQNASTFRNLIALHATNHILKGRDRVLKNNEKLKTADNAVDLECRDQGFVRPKVLIMIETRQMAANYVDSIVRIFQPDQQENRKRFDDAFTAPQDERNNMPDDFRELFSGNNDNSFLTALKFTRKTLKFYSGFYNSDIIIASPLGLRRILENEDDKKRDHDFLSSIELVAVDQADAMQMQSWENIELVFKHLNLELQEAHGCDFSRVRNWYLDGHAKYVRQTIILSAYITPEMNRLFNSDMLNIAGKAKIAPNYDGAIIGTSGMGVRQTFSRFDSLSPLDDPNARFKYFTTAIVPGLLRMPKHADGVQGILIFIPSYFDFLRVRNYFATSTQTENVSFGAIHDYNDISEQRRARSHFLSGRHSILLYTQRAHHFFRLKIRGVKRVVMYALPDNPIFYQELVDGYIGTSLNEGKIEPPETGVRSLFSKWDTLRLERIVGSSRIKSMSSGSGDTFDFV